MQLTEYCLQITLAHAFFSKIKHALGISVGGGKKSVNTLFYFSNANSINVSDL